MTERKTTPWLSIAILVVVVTNLTLTAWLWLERGNVATVATTAEPSLPEFADDAYLQTIADHFVALYNADDAAVFYAEFDQLARIQFTEDELKDELSKLNSVIGQVDSTAFIEFEYNKYGSYSLYVLHYRTRLSGGAFPSGRLKLTVVDRGDHFGLIGFNLVGESQ